MSGTHKKLLHGNNFNHWNFLDLVFYLKYFSFSHPKPTHVPNDESLSPNLQFSLRIWYVEQEMARFSTFAAWAAWS